MKDLLFSIEKLYGLVSENKIKDEEVQPLTAFLEFNSQNFKGYKEIDENSGFYNPDYDIKNDFVEDSRILDNPDISDSFPFDHELNSPIKHSDNTNQYKTIQGGAPRKSPPNYIPVHSSKFKNVGYDLLSSNIFSNVFLWLNNGQSFWFFPTFVGRRIISGFRWHVDRWFFISLSINSIDSLFFTNRN